MVNLFCTIPYASALVSLVLIYIPAQVAGQAGITYPKHVRAPQFIGLIVGTIGSLFALWCVVTFAWWARGNRPRLIIRANWWLLGHTRIYEIPYVGATLALAGAPRYFESPAPLGYTAVFLV